MAFGDHAAVRTSLMVERWDAEQVEWARRRHGAPPSWEPSSAQLRAAVAPYSVTVDEDCNMVLQAGWVALLGGIAGADMSPKFSATAGRIGIGTSTAATSYTQTQLQADTGSASTTSYYQLCGSAPTITTSSTPPTLVFGATFQAGVASFAWNEFCIDNYTASGVTTQGTGATVLNRGVSPQGTKGSGLVWATTAVLSFGYPSGSGSLQ